LNLVLTHNNKLNKKNIDFLLQNFSIEDIECALVKLFLKEKKILKVENSFLKKFIKNSNNIEKIITFFQEKNLEINLKNIERTFELLIPQNDRELNGAFYTPDFIVDYIVDNTVFDDYKVCDPACGSGAFLVSATKKISKLTKKNIIQVIEDNIVGCDILDYNIKRTKIILTLLALENREDKKSIKFNLINDNSLNYDWKKNLPKKYTKNERWKNIFNTDFDDSGFDAIIGNPPYVRIQDLKLFSKEELLKKWKVVNGGNFNLYFAFFELGKKLLKKDRKLGFIVPNNYFTSFAAEKLRRWMQENKIIDEIIDFSHLLLFQDALTYTCITILSKTKKNKFKYVSISDSKNLNEFAKLKRAAINFDDLNPKKWRLMPKKDFENIKKIETIGTPLGIVTQINSGIATLKDKLYFINSRYKADNNHFIKSNDGRQFLIQKEITKKVFKISNFDNDEQIKENTLRIIFPYKKTSTGFEIIPEDELKSKYPKCYEYFVSIKDELAKRDKGKKTYQKWYAYGRGQGFGLTGRKLLTPTFSKKPKFLLDDEGDSLFCNGYSLSNSKLDLKILQKILNSKLMDYYITNTSVQIDGGYPCFQKNFIEKFSIPEFSQKEKDFLLHENSKEKIDAFLLKKYELII